MAMFKRNKASYAALIMLLACLCFMLAACVKGKGGTEIPDPVTYTVTFDSQGGSNVQSKTVAAGAKVAEPTPPPTKSGSEFGGWFKETACSNPWDFEVDTVNSNITLYAKWTEDDSDIKNIAVTTNGVMTWTKVSGATTYTVRSGSLSSGDINNASFDLKQFSNFRNSRKNSITLLANKKDKETQLEVEFLSVEVTVLLDAGEYFKTVPNVYKDEYVTLTGFEPELDGGVAVLNMEQTGSYQNVIKANTGYKCNLYYTDDFQTLSAVPTYFTQPDYSQTRYLKVTDSDGTYIKTYTIRFHLLREFSLTLYNQYYYQGKTELYREPEDLLENSTVKFSRLYAYYQGSNENIKIIDGNFNVYERDDTIKIKSDLSLYFIAEDEIAVNKAFGYTLYDDHAVITGFARSRVTDAVITVPGTINGLPVTEISELAFERVTTVREVIIPDSVQKIGKNLFYESEGIQKLTLPFIGETVEDNTRLLGWLFNAWVQEQAHLHNGEVVPNTLTTVILTKAKYISPNAFIDCSRITSVTLPQTLTSIGSNAFKGCTRLADITLHKAVTAVGVGAFSGCTGLSVSWDYNPSLTAANFKDYLTSVSIDDGIASVEANAFLNCTKLSGVILPDSVTAIGANAFSGCTGLTAFEISNKVTSVGGGAFAGCTQLEITWNYNSSITATNLTEYLTRVNIGEEVTAISNSAFASCVKLIDVTIPDTVFSVGAYAFYGCVKLTEVIIPDSVSTLGAYAFYGCILLEEITLSSNITAIGENTFNGCQSLAAVTIPGKVDSIGNSAFTGCSLLNNVVIPNNAAVGREVFSGCTALTKITLPLSILSIGADSFLNTGLWNNTEDNSVVYADKWVVGYKGHITNVSLNADTVRISSQAFLNCTGLTNIVVPDSVQQIDSGAFSGCGYLASITLPFTGASRAADGEKKCLGFIFGGNSYSGGTSIQQRYSLTDYRYFYFPSGLTSVTVTEKIHEYAFSNCNMLTSITVAESVLLIPAYTFYNCSKLESFNIPESVTSIGESAFAGTKVGEVAENNTVIYLNDWAIRVKGTLSGDIVVKDGTLAIADNLFSGNGITSVTVPDSVIRIGKGAFYGRDIIRLTLPFVGAELNGTKNTNFTYVTGGRVHTNLTVVITGGTSIPANAFKSHTGLISITLASTLTEIGDSAFEYCSSLQSIIIPQNVSRIGRYAFNGCAVSSGVTFENTSNWYVTNTENATSGTPVDLANALTNAANLNSNYCYYYWYRSEN